MCGLGCVFSKVRFDDYIAALSPLQMKNILREALEEESQKHPNSGGGRLNAESQKPTRVKLS